MSTPLYAFYTLCYVYLFVRAARLVRRTRRSETLFLALVIFGLLYDNLILAAGGFLPASQSLYWLSVPRFVLHQLLLPWIMITALGQAARAGIAWAGSLAAKRAVYAGAALLVIAGILTRLTGLNLQPAVLDGVTRYMAIGVSGPPIVSIVSIFFAGVIGFLIWRRSGWPWNFVTAALVFIGEGVPIEAVRRLAGSGVEVVVMGVMLGMEDENRDPAMEHGALRRTQDRLLRGPRTENRRAESSE